MEKIIKIFMFSFLLFESCTNQYGKLNMEKRSFQNYTSKKQNFYRNDLSYFWSSRKSTFKEILKLGLCSYALFSPTLAKAQIVDQCPFNVTNCLSGTNITSTIINSNTLQLEFKKFQDSGSFCDLSHLTGNIPPCVSANITDIMVSGCNDGPPDINFNKPDDCVDDSLSYVKFDLLDPKDCSPFAINITMQGAIIGTDEDFCLKGRGDTLSCNVQNYFSCSNITSEPTNDPTFDPTNDPTNDPTFDLTNDPTNDPTFNPTNDPTNDPTFTNNPTNDPTPNPLLIEEDFPTPDPTFETTLNPTKQLTKSTLWPTPFPTKSLKKSNKSFPTKSIKSTEYTDNAYKANNNQSASENDKSYAWVMAIPLGIGIICCCILAFCIWLCYRETQRSRKYDEVPDNVAEDEGGDHTETILIEQT